MHQASRWIREGPAAHLFPWRVRDALERWTVRHGYPAGAPPRLALTSAEGAPAARLLFGGDLAFHRWDPAQPGTGRFDPLARLFGSADLAVANLEAQLTTQTQPASTLGTSLRADPRALSLITQLGLSVVSCANNHAVDFGGEALAESLAHLNGAGIRAVGAARSGRDAGCVIPVRNIRVGLLAYADDWRPPGPDDPGPLPNPYDPAEVRADITRLRSEADIVVVQLHWGYEWTVYPPRTLRDAARSLIDAGADVVVCHHAHVPLTLERWGRGVIAHGLGNLYFGPFSGTQHPLRNFSYVLAVEVSAGGVHGAEALPVGTREDGVVGPAEGASTELVGRCLTLLARRLNDDAYLDRVEAALLQAHAASLMLDLGGRIDRGDRAGYADRIRHLASPLHRRLVLKMQSAEGPPAGWARLLEALRSGGESFPSGAVASDLIRERAAAGQWLARQRTPGRIP